MIRYKLVLKGALLASLACLWLAPSSYAANSTAIAQGYGVKGKVELGMIVRQTDSDASKIETVSLKDETKVLGVVVPSSEPPVVLSDGTKSQVFVSNFGRYEVLVSDQNGAIKAGDYIAVSSLAGTGMKADDSQRIVIGRAVKGFNGRTGVQKRTEVNTGRGKQTVAVGHIPVDMNVAQNPLNLGASYVPGILASFAQSVSGGRPVSPAKTYVSLAVLLVSAVLAGSILYAGVKSAMTAIGRNPLAKSSIWKNLLQVIFASVMIFVIGIFAVYLLLKL